MALLELTNLSLCYGPIQALKNISLTIEEGEVVAMLGANGAGKTSILRTISGLETATSGSITFEGDNLLRFKPSMMVQKGIAHSPEGRRIFSQMTVRENLEVGALNLQEKNRYHDLLDKVFGYFPILKSRLDQAGGTLSGGEQQMLAVGRALMSGPKLLMLDEPSLGLAPRYIDQIFEIIERVNKEEGVTVFLIEQNANEALQYSDRAYVLENGEITLSGKSEELRHDESIRSAYLGL